MWVLQKVYVERLVTLLTQLSVSAIYLRNFVLVRSTHTAYCVCELLIQISADVVYSHMSVSVYTA